MFIYHSSLGILSIRCWKNIKKQGSAHGSAQGSAQLYVNGDDHDDNDDDDHGNGDDDDDHDDHDEDYDDHVIIFFQSCQVPYYKDVLSPTLPANGLLPIPIPIVNTLLPNITGLYFVDHVVGNQPDLTMEDAAKW